MARLPVQGRLIEPLGDRPGDVEAAVHLVDVAGAKGELGAMVGSPEQQDRVTDTLGAFEGFGRPGQGLFEQLWQ